MTSSRKTARRAPIAVLSLTLLFGGLVAACDAKETRDTRPSQSPPTTTAQSSPGGASSGPEDDGGAAGSNSDPGNQPESSGEGTP